MRAADESVDANADRRQHDDTNDGEHDDQAARQRNGGHGLLPDRSGTVAVQVRGRPLAGGGSSEAGGLGWPVR